MSKNKSQISRDTIRWLYWVFLFLYKCLAFFIPINYNTESVSPCDRQGVNIANSAREMCVRFNPIYNCSKSHLCGWIRAEKTSQFDPPPVSHISAYITWNIMHCFHLNILIASIFTPWSQHFCSEDLCYFTTNNFILRGFKHLLRTCMISLPKIFV